MRYKIGDIVVADNADFGSLRPLFVFGYISGSDETDNTYEIEWTGASKKLESTDDYFELGTMGGYSEKNIEIYRRIYQDWLEDSYDPKKYP